MVRLRFLSRKRRRSAFWYLGRGELTVAVLEPTADEPLLLACASLRAEIESDGVDLAPGLLDASIAAGASDLPHVAALDEPWCGIEPDSAADHESVAGEPRVRIGLSGRDDLVVTARERAVVLAAERFERARLRLVWLDCAACALVSLAAALGRGNDREIATIVAAARQLDPLTAVSVAPGCEAAASRIGKRLAVPVGLALARFGTLPDA